MEIKNQEEALEVAKELERIEATRKTMRDALRKFVEENGEVDTGETVWSIKESTSWRHDEKSLRKIAEAIAMDGKNPWEFMNITPANLRNLGFTEESLEKMGSVPRVSKRFSSRVSR